MLHPVIMAGGSGARLWPLSRQLNPKQFLRLADAQLSMLQATVHRLQGMAVALPLAEAGRCSSARRLDARLRQDAARLASIPYAC